MWLLSRKAWLRYALAGHTAKKRYDVCNLLKRKYIFFRRKIPNFSFATMASCCRRKRSSLRSFLSRKRVSPLHKTHKLSSGSADEGSGGEAGAVKSLTNSVECKLRGVVFRADVSEHHVLNAALDQLDRKSGAIVV